MILRVAWMIICVSLLTSGAYAYDDRGLRDPFWPLVSSSGAIVNYGQDVSVSDMILEGIVASGNGVHTAIVNGSVVEVGDLVGQYEVVGIEEKKVILSKDTEIFDLNLKKGGE